MELRHLTITMVPPWQRITAVLIETPFDPLYYFMGPFYSLYGPLNFQFVSVPPWLILFLETSGSGKHNDAHINQLEPLEHVPGPHQFPVGAS